MSRYIDADALIQALCADNDGIGRADAKAVMTCLEDVFSIVDDAPSIDIVRCGECKHREEYPCKVYHDDDWYCADGERREP